MINDDVPVINEGEDIYPRLHDEYENFSNIINNHNGKIKQYKNLFIKKHGEDIYPRLHDEYENFSNIINNHNGKIKQYKNLFIKKHGPNQSAIPGFRWQQSFHDHVIRNDKDFYKHLNYIALNCVKHRLCENEKNYRWSFLNKEFNFLIDDF
ncbi:MAG: hypothetical protein PHS62_01090 [Patescibacteria group bacterium]|nr:hypothetical protein [Patescibacteria group bacterium]